MTSKGNSSDGQVRSVTPDPGPSYNSIGYRRPVLWEPGAPPETDLGRSPYLPEPQFLPLSIRRIASLACRDLGLGDPGGVRPRPAARAKLSSSYGEDPDAGRLGWGWGGLPGGRGRPRLQRAAAGLPASAGAVAGTRAAGRRGRQLSGARWREAGSPHPPCQRGPAAPAAQPWRAGTRCGPRSLPDPERRRGRGPPESRERRGRGGAGASRGMGGARDVRRALDSAHRPLPPAAGAAPGGWGGAGAGRRMGRTGGACAQHLTPPPGPAPPWGEQRASSDFSLGIHAAAILRSYIGHKRVRSQTRFE